MLEQEERIALEPQAPPAADQSSILKYVLLAAAAIYVIASLYLLYGLKARIVGLEQKQQTLEAEQADLVNRLRATSSELRQSLSSEVGTTKQQLDERAAELERAQKASAAHLAAQQRQQSQQIADVSGQVSTVKTDVGAAKTDIVKTQTDLAATNEWWRRGPRF